MHPMTPLALVFVLLMASCGGPSTESDSTTATLSGAPSTDGAVTTTTTAATTTSTTPATTRANTTPKGTSTSTTTSTTTSTVLNTPAPLLEITDPSDGATVASATFTFRGRTDPGCIVSVGGRYFADVDAAGNWAIDLLLQPGRNATTFTATDSAGSVATARVKVFLEDAVTTLPPPPKPEACGGPFVGEAVYPDVEALAQAMVGRWLFCHAVLEPDDPFYPPFFDDGEDVIGLQILPGRAREDQHFPALEGRYQLLTGTPDAPMLLTGWGNEGRYVLIDASISNEPDTWQLEVHPDGGRGYRMAVLTLTRDQRILSVWGMPGIFVYARAE